MCRVACRCVMHRTLLETVSTCFLIQERELGVDHFAMAIGKPRMSGTLLGKTVVYCRERQRLHEMGAHTPEGGGESWQDHVQA